MKPTSLHITATAIMLVAACSKPPTDSQADKPMPTSIEALQAEIRHLRADRDRFRAERDKALATGRATPTPEPQRAVERTGELTRQIAEQLLDQHLASPHVSQLAFKKGGLQQAQQDGIVAEAGGFPPSYHFTPKGIELAHGLVDANTRVELAAFGMQDPKFTLPSPIAESVHEVTGIALAPVPNICEAEYVTVYMFPAGAEQIGEYIYSGQHAKATFQKYDDGWRVSNE